MLRIPYYSCGCAGAVPGVFSPGLLFGFVLGLSLSLPFWCDLNISFSFMIYRA